jgi:L-alanine-DL-glutamate epimerase-like enolase superfamily enzyme
MPSIRHVTAYPLEYPEPNDAGRLRHVTLVRVDTDDGAAGWGECISQWPEAALAVKTVVERGLAPLLAGRDPTEVRPLWELMREHTFWTGRGGIASFALSAVDTALWDLAGKLAGEPVHRLLGGKIADDVPACASLIWDPGDLEWTAAEVRHAVERGYAAVKCGWGRDPATAFGTDTERDVAAVACVREAVGPEVAFSVDVSGRVRWTAAHAIEMAARLEPYDLAWLEDPLPHEDYDGYRSLRAAAAMPIATGERDWTVEDYRLRIGAGGVDILLVDPGRVEGLTGMKLAVDEAAAAGVRFVPHSWSSAINTAAALHVFAASPNGVVFELKLRPSPMQHELVAQPFEQEGGRLAVPDRPGLGCEVDEAAVERYSFA